MSKVALNNDTKVYQAPVAKKNENLRKGFMIACGILLTGASVFATLKSKKSIDFKKITNEIQLGRLSDTNKSIFKKLDLKVKTKNFPADYSKSILLYGEAGTGRTCISEQFTQRINLLTEKDKLDNAFKRATEYAKEHSNRQIRVSIDKVDALFEKAVS